MKLNFQKLDELTLGDKEFALELLAMYQQQFEEYIRDLANTESLTYELVSSLNHRIKSSAVLLEAESLLKKQKELAHQLKATTDFRELVGSVIVDCQNLIGQLQNYVQNL